MVLLIGSSVSGKTFDAIGCTRESTNDLTMTSAVGNSAVIALLRLLYVRRQQNKRKKINIPSIAQQHYLAII